MKSAVNGNSDESGPPSGAGDLVTARRDRVLAAMADVGLDVLVFGRQDNAGYACGIRRLWTAGTRPFGAGCVVVGSTRRVHAMSSWEAGIDDSMNPDDLYPLTWNPRIMAASMAAIDGMADARRIGVDELTPSFRRAAAGFAPRAEIVPADDLMAGVRRRKLPGEIDAIERACDAAWAGVDAVLAAPAPAAPAPAAVAIEALAGVGVTVMASTLRVEPRNSGIFIDIGVIRALYEGGVGGCFINGERTGPADLIAACRPGATHRDLASVAATGTWGVRGLGMGFERPIINAALGGGERLEAGMVLDVTDGDRRDVVAVTAEGPVILSKRPNDRAR